MRKVRLSVAASLDGFIAGPNGENDWIVMDPEMDFGTLMASFDTIVMGRETYQVMRKHGAGPMPGMQTYVFSRTLQQDDCPHVIVSSDPVQKLAELKAMAGKDIWLFGGGSLLRSLLELKLVDTLEIAIIPVLLGAGVPLVAHPAKQTKLKLVKQRIYEKTGTAALVYQPI